MGLFRRLVVREKGMSPQSLEIIKARQFLERTHKTYFPLYEAFGGNGRRDFHYFETSQKGEFRRHHFFQGCDTRMFFVVLCDKELKQIEAAFKEKAGDGYAYKDSIFTKESGIQHRFYRPNSHNTSITFMNDETGEVWGGLFAMDEDME